MAVEPQTKGLERTLQATWEGAAPSESSITLRSIELSLGESRWTSVPHFYRRNFTLPENARAVVRAFAEFGIPLIDITEKDLATEGTQFVLGVAPVMLDFLTSVPPLSFAKCWKRRNPVPSGDDVHLYLSFDDLCIAKKHAARWQDLADMEELGRVRTNQVNDESNDSE